MANHGVAFADRWRVLRERVLAMRTIWREETPEFHGEYVDFDPIWSYPKPARNGGPPVLIGASSRWTWQRIAEYGDGWFPIHQDPRRAAAQGAVDYREGIARTLDAWSEAGRSGDPDFTIFGVGPDGARVEALLEMGFNRVVFGLPPADPDTVLPLLDQYAAIGAAINR
jgi:alkanesulfonate monooxygenase SsuD/methylene tetrahydromethanopterin reductase-like flavin-dependent oxidoreductase (luciferase family)